jgi:tripartite-type tricarboxylate transporter receptor subunit TctC
MLAREHLPVDLQGWRRMHRFQLVIACLLWLCAGTPVVMSQPAPLLTYPRQPIRLLVGFPAGGNVDVLARLLAVHIGPRLGQPILVENRVGQAGTLATVLGARSAADGYTLIMADIGTLAVNPHVYPGFPIDTLHDLQPLSRLVSFQLFVFVPAELPARTLQGFVALVRPWPSRWNFASAGAGGIVHVAGELFMRAAGIELVHVPYRGTVQSMADLANGRVHLQIDSWGAGEALVRSGRVRALANTGRERAPFASEVPTVREQGIDFELNGWQAMVGPAGLPGPIVDRLNAEIRRALNDIDVSQRIRQFGAEPAPSSVEELRSLIALERERMGHIVREAKIKAE